MTNNHYFNPVPITKLIVTIFLALNLTVTQNEIFASLTVAFIALFFALNAKIKTSVKTLIFYGLVILLLKNIGKIEYAFVKNYIVIFLVVIKLFFIPILAGNFLIATSDVSSIIASLEKIKTPKALVIPIAVIFRYFPAFKNDKKNIQMAMRMRGISRKNPIRYFEFVSVPLLISATTIADDISKVAETRCIADPCKKTRYTELKFTLADLVFIAGILTINVLGRLFNFGG